MNMDQRETEVLEAKASWQDAALALHRAKADYDYAEKKLTLARDQFLLAAMRERTSLPQDMLYELQPIEYLGLTLKQAAQKALYALKTATADQLVEYMQARGFQFAGEVPVRELHGALLKQPWAWRNQNEGVWEYQNQ